MKYKLGYLGRTVKKPATYVFEELELLTHSGASLPRGWNSIREIDAVMPLLFRAEGWNDGSAKLVLDYKSFAAFMANKDRQEFTWLTTFLDGRCSTLHLNEPIYDCKFLEETELILYVPESFGLPVLDLGKMGITSTKKTESGDWVGVRWDGKEIPYRRGKANLNTRVMFENIA